MKRISDIPKAERPREKLHRLGAGSLSDTELIAILLGSGTRKYDVMELSNRIIRAVDEEKRMGVCLDTSHAFGAGYDLATGEGLERTLAEFQEEIGLEKLHLVHLNDTRSPLGGHVDRHWHIAEGNIGLDGFRNIVNHPLLVHLPGIMETPRKDDVEDLRNMEVIRSLVEANPQG